MVIINEWQQVKSNFDVIKHELERLGATREERAVCVAGAFGNIERKLKQVDTKVLVLASKLGDELMLSNNGSKTLWETLKEMAEEISALANTEAMNHKTVVQLGNEAILKVQEVQNSMDSLVTNLVDFKEHYIGTIQSLADEIRKAKAVIAASYEGQYSLGCQDPRFTFLWATTHRSFNYPQLRFGGLGKLGSGC